MIYKTIRIDEKYDGQVLEVVLNAPPANVLSAEMMGELSQVWVKESQNSKRKLLVLRGEGSHFSYGASVEEHAPGRVHEMLPDFHRMIGKVLSCEIPTLALVSGFCLGGGFELALACTFLMAEESAKFAVPEIQLGVFPPVAAALLPILCGGARANQMVVLGDRVSGADMKSFGLVNETFASGGADAALQAFVEKKILPKSASSLRMAHRATRGYVVEHYDEWIGRLERLYLKDLMSTRDAVEGITSFIEKRQPKWVDA